MNEAIELLPCPFCGREPIVCNFFDGFFWYWRIRCRICALMMEYVSSNQDPIDGIAKRWNRRTEANGNNT